MNKNHKPTLDNLNKFGFVRVKSKYPIKKVDKVINIKMDSAIKKDNIIIKKHDIA